MPRCPEDIIHHVSWERVTAEATNASDRHAPSKQEAGWKRLRGGHSRRFQAGRPHGPRRCGGPEHSVGYS
jgi:hypothetical protein